jgi:hypothetical protein
MIFLISFCVRVQMTVKRVVTAPKHSVMDRASWLDCNRGWKWIRKKIPGTTIVLEWSRADTGVGLSTAEGSHG